MAVVGFCGYGLPFKQLNLRFLLLALATVVIGSRVSIKIPRVKAHISVSDTFIFLTLVLFGGEAAVLVAAAEALCSSFRIGKKAETHFFNSSVMALSTFLTYMSLRLSFGQVLAVNESYSADFVVALCLMAVVQYLSNSLLIATGSALKAGEPIWLTWRKNFLWTSLTYFAGASAAGFIARMIGNAGFFAFLATTPIIAIVYFTYWTYMKNVEAAANQAEQARRHVEELNRHIAEQERMSKALQETQEHFRNAFDYAAIGMALVSTQGSWLRVNRSLCEILGYTTANRIHKVHIWRIHPLRRRHDFLEHVAERNHFEHSIRLPSRSSAATARAARRPCGPSARRRPSGAAGRGFCP